MTTDTERLQWFADQDGKFVIRKSHEGYMIWDISVGLCLAGKGDTIQSAIDKAMKYIDGEWYDS